MTNPSSTLLSLFPISAAILPERGLAVAGQSLDDLADRYGTPLYLFDGQTLREQIASLQGLLAAHYPGEAAVAYAAKAYFSGGFARRLAGMGVELDVVSLGELRAAHQAGFPAGAVHQHGNNKSEAELAAALEWGIHAVVVDNLDELGLLEELAEKRGQAARIWLRVTPDLDVRTHPHIDTGSADSKFGLHLENGQAEEGIRRAQSSRWLTPLGLHFHLGSQLADPEPYQEAVERVFALAEKTGLPLEEFSPGGGWGVRYTEADPPDDPAPWITAVCRAVREGCALRGWRLPRLVVEPGRWLVARAGVAVYSVGTQKETVSGAWVVAVDGGMADNPRPALYGSRYTACSVRAPLAAPARTVRLAGRFCESGDVLIDEVALPEVKRGDRLAIPASGAYQLALSSNYNLAPRPAVLWLEDGQAEILQERETQPGSGWW